MPENWKICRVEDIADPRKGSTVTGPFGSSIGRKYWKDQGIPIIRGNNIGFEGPGFIDGNYIFVSEEYYNLKMKRYTSIADDIIFTAAGTIGQVGIIPKNTKYSFYIVSNKQMRLRVSKEIVDPKFAFYYFRTKKLRQLILANNTGSTIPLINLSVLRNLPFPLAPLPEQHAIASILSALDDKIELNLQMNKTLEEMAMNLYKHWFVDFGPFQNGEFEDSELGMIPKEWEVKRLDEISHKKVDTFNFKDKDEVVFVNTGDVQEGRFLHSNKTSKIGLPGQAKKAIAKGDILYSEIRPKNKRYAYVNFDSSNYVVSTKFMIINPKENILTKLLYRILTMQSTVDNFNSIAEGRSGTFPQITFDAIREMQVVLPPIQVQHKFQDIVSPMELQQDELYIENQTLTTLRDTLLPKLISGEVRVKDTEKTLAAML